LPWRAAYRRSPAPSDVGHTLAKADAIIVLGCHDTRVAERGAQLFLDGWAPLIVFSGHLGALTSGTAADAVRAQHQDQGRQEGRRRHPAQACQFPR
jgi:hypothetical protein